MPNRIIKETLRESKAVCSLSDFQFRVWVCLITYVDDYGRGKDDAQLLSSILFPRSKVPEKQIADAMKVLADKGLIVKYSSDGDNFFYFPKWKNHQRIQARKPKFPEPPPYVTESHGESPWDTVDDGDSPYESNPIQSNKKKESNPNPNTIQSKYEEFSCGDEKLYEALIGFEEMRTKIKKPLTDKARSMILQKLQTFPRHQWADILNQSIMHDWQTIYPLKEEKKDKKTNNIFLEMLEEDDE
jgi:hypothetical protein